MAQRDTRPIRLEIERNPSKMRNVVYKFKTMNMRTIHIYFLKINATFQNIKFIIEYKTLF